MDADPFPVPTSTRSLLREAHGAYTVTFGVLDTDTQRLERALGSLGVKVTASGSELDTEMVQQQEQEQEQEVLQNEFTGFGDWCRAGLLASQTM